MVNRLTDKIVLITGAAGGLGRAFALAFAKEGARLIVTDLEASGLEETAALLKAQGAFCSSHRIDLAVEKEIQDFGAEISRTQPRLDVLINNAGIAYGEITRGFENLTQEKWLRYFAVNTVAPLILAQALRKPLAQARGLIINQSSMASYLPATAYGLTKAALNAMTFGMANAFGADGIRVNAIAPGIMEKAASSTTTSSAAMPATGCAAIAVDDSGAGSTEKPGETRPIHLERGCSGKFIDKPPPDRNVRRRNMLPQVSFEVGLAGRFDAGFELDGGSRHLSQPPVGNADDRRRRDGGMQQQGTFYRLGQQLETAAHDGAVGAPAMKEKAVFIDHRDVGGADPLRPNSWRNDLEQAFVAGRHELAGPGSDDTQLRPG